MSNPFISVINSIFTDVKTWLLSLVGIITVVVVIKNGYDYQGGDSSEKQEAVRNIKKAIKMGGGIFILAWFAMYVFDKFNGVA